MDTLTVDDIDEALGDSSAQAIDLFMKSVLTGDVSLLAKMLGKSAPRRSSPLLPFCVNWHLIFRQLYEHCALKWRRANLHNGCCQITPSRSFQIKASYHEPAQSIEKHMLFNIGRN